MTGVGEDPELIELRHQYTEHVRAMTRLLDVEEDQVGATLLRLAEHGRSFQLVDALNRVLDERAELLLQRASAAQRLRDGGDYYAAAIVEGQA